MNIYQNLGGNSSVVAYVMQPDAIDVLFRGGKWYRYSYKSAGCHNVEAMKSLAVQGRGLCSYIHQHVKYNYEP